MIHYGDITKIKGSEIPIVDIVTGGSPCQDLSVAGKRAGLDGERSGLFMEQIRIIKEMREVDIQNGKKDEFIRPRYMVWENVTGAFSSNKGEDFRIVLEETAKVKDKNAVIPGLKGGQKWTPSGVILGDGWSIAWRVHDAQFWGVPQRRKRIALVADFGGSTAPEILFERKGLSGNTPQSECEGQEVTGAVGEGSDSAGCYTLKIRGGREVDSQGKKAGKGPLVQTELSGTIGVSQDQTLIAKQKDKICYGISSYDSNSMKSSNPNSEIYEADTSRTLDNNGGNPSCNQGGICVLEGNGSRPSHRGDGFAESETSYTLNSTEKHAVCTYQQTTGPLCASGYDKQGTQEATNDMYVVSHGGFMTNADSSGKAHTLQATDYKDPQCVCYGFNRERCGAVTMENKVPTIQAAAGESGNNQPSVCYGLDRASFNQGKNAKYDISVQEEIAQPIVARGPGGY